MVGQMYARIGTTDWVPEAAKQKATEFLGGVVEWVDEGQLKEARKKASASTDMTVLRELISAQPKKKRKQEVIDAVLAVLREGNFVADDKVEALKKRLNNDEGLAALIKG